MTGAWSFHHIGIACRDLQRAEGVYGILGYGREGAVFEDRVQGVRGLFLAGAGPRLELVVDLPGGRVIEPWLTKGDAMYHMAFEVPDIEAALAEQVGDGAKLVVGPRPAVAFGGRSVAFLMSRNLTLVELVARP